MGIALPGLKQNLGATFFQRKFRRPSLDKFLATPAVCQVYSRNPVSAVFDEQPVGLIM